MSVLKIKNENDEWESVPVIKGEKGDKGDKGDSGASTWGDITGSISNQTDLKDALDSKANISDLATVATSGSYTDLTNTPTIPEVGNRKTWYGTCSTSGDAQTKNITCVGFVEENGATIDVKFSNENTYDGTSNYMALSVNGEEATSMAVPIVPGEWRAGEIVRFIYFSSGWRIISKELATSDFYGITKLSSATNSTSTSLAATPRAVKAAYDLANRKQDAITSSNKLSYTLLTDTPTIPTKVSDLTNDSGFITNTVNNLTNYYTKTNTYSKSEVDNLISTVSSLDIEVVQTLPTQDISTSTIYLVPNSSSSQENIYDEYIYVNNNWELIGNTSISLSWGNISGTLSNQTDLQEVLDGKIPYTQVTDRTFSIWDSADGWYKLPYNTMIRYKGDSTSYYLLQGDLNYIFISSHHSGNQKIYALFESGGLKTGFTSSTSGTYPKIVLNKDDIKNNLTTSYTGYALDASQGKVLNDSKQDTLVSGTNIKTINNESILGSGNINISAGGGGTMTDMRVNNSSVVTDNVGNIVTESAYDPSTNKIATINDLPTVPTKTSDLTNDSGFIDNTYHDNNKQDTLVSGTNIKTINNESILGSGNISLAATETDPVFTSSAASGITSSDIAKWDNAIQYYSWDTSHNVYNVTHNSSLASLLTVTNNKINISNIPTPLTISDSSNTIPTTDQVYTALQKKQDKITNSNKLSYTLLEDTPTIPDELADLSDDSTHRVVTDAEKTVWNNKSDFSGSYNDLTDKPIYDASYVFDAADEETTITNAQYQELNNASLNGKIIIVYGATVIPGTEELDGLQYRTLTYLVNGNLAIKVIISPQNNNHIVTYEEIELASSSDLASKQDTLVSGTNIKTINSQSIVGSGNVDFYGTELPIGTEVDYDGSTAPTGWVETENRIGKLLWEGSFSSGSITVPGISDYVVVAMIVGGVTCLGSQLYGGCSFTRYNSMAIDAYGYRFTYSAANDRLTIDSNNKGGTSGTASQPITKIYGVF